MSLELLIAKYGYWALAFGTVLEGEGIVLLAGFWAHLGVLNLALVVFIAFLAATIGNTLAFLTGKYFGRMVAPRLSRHSHKLERISSYLQRHQVMFILGFRFLYGVRSFIPYLLGMSRIATLRFFWLNALGSFLWAGLFSYLGFVAGGGLHILVKDVRLLQKISLGLFLLVILGQVTVFLMHRHKANSEK